MSAITARDLLSDRPQISAADSISDRLSQELVIALVGPIGSGVSTAAGYLREILIQNFKYVVPEIIKPSDIIKAEAHRVGSPIPYDLPLNRYVSLMQDTGNRLREVFGNNYLAEKIVEKICKYRTENGGYKEDIHMPGRRAYIIDSLKSLEELDLLRQIYGETLCVFGIFAPDAQRRTRLLDLGVPDSEIQKILDRDQNEPATFGQKTRKLFVMSDFFVCNDQKREELRRKISRFLNMTFDTVIHTPTRAESAMYEASSSAANSACMSRQVGAAIVSEGGELISVGWNDVPRFGGGLYLEDDQLTLDISKGSILDKDNRCFKWGGCICHNETRRTKIIDKIAQKILQSGILKKDKTFAQVRTILVGTDVDSLIEFSRSIHAEMEAILAVAREGKHSLRNATLYTNTYPCHNCARHIVASGITTVVYIEPYLKSLAVELHYDAITENIEEIGKVIFRQYDGVAPRTFLKLFRPVAERKIAGKVSKCDPQDALPIFRVLLDSQADYEANVIAELAGKEHSLPVS